MEVILREDIENLGTRGAGSQSRAGVCPQFPAAEAAGRGGHRIQQEDRGAGTPGAPPQGSQGSGRGAGSGQDHDRGDRPIAQKAGENDQLFGSVTSKDIAEALAAQNYTIDRRKIQLDEPIKQLGEYKVPVRLHKDVTVEITVVVAKEE